MPGSMARSASQPGPPAGCSAGSTATRPSRDRCRESGECPPASAGQPDGPKIGREQLFRTGKGEVEAGPTAGHLVPRGPGDPAGQRPGAGDRDLLADHHPDDCFPGRPGTHDAQSRPGRHQRPEHVVATQRALDVLQAPVEVEQRSDSADLGGGGLPRGSCAVDPDLDRRRQRQTASRGRHGRGLSRGRGPSPGRGRSCHEHAVVGAAAVGAGDDLVHAGSRVGAQPSQHGHCVERTERRNGHPRPRRRCGPGRHGRRHLLPAGVSVDAAARTPGVVKTPTVVETRGVVETKGIEPSTPALQRRCSAN